jgi:DNA-binding beta-propeller fold protein YncE
VPGTDPDGNPLVFSSSLLPTGATLDPATGRFRWTPSIAQLGITDLVFAATDPSGLVARTAIRLLVSAQPVTPVVTIVQTPSFPALPGQAVTLQVLASGIADITSLALSVNGLALTLDAQGRATFTPATAGRFDVLATATDIQGAIGLATAVLKVRDPADTTAPTATLITPLPRTVISVPTAVRASVQDTNLDAYLLELVDLATGAARTLATGHAAVNDLALASIDPNALRNGAYLLRLTAADITGRLAVSQYLVEINTPAKSGAYTEAVTDLSTTLNGTPVTLTRQYDSLAATLDGSLGAGWWFRGLDSRATATTLPTGRESDGLFNPLTEGASVYLDVPGGQRLRFAFTPVAIPLGRGLVVYDVAWQPTAGYSLNTTEAALQQVGGAYYEIATGLPYHPAQVPADHSAYLLTAPDGTTYHYDRDGQLLETITASANRISWSDSGAVATNGDRIVFETDGGGRISKASAPKSGQTVSYTYGARNTLVTVINPSAGAVLRYGYSAELLTYTSSRDGGTALAYGSDGLLDGMVKVALNLGGPGTFNRVPASVNAVDGTPTLVSFHVTARELASSATGSVALRLASSFGAAPSVEGAIVVADGTAGQAVMLVTAPGVYVMDFGDSAVGAHSLTLSIAGDVDGDNDIDAADANAFSGTPAERTLLDRGFGFTANRAPVVIAGSATTPEGFPVTIPLGSLGADPNLDPIEFFATNLVGGTVRIDGAQAFFSPAVGFRGAGGFDLLASDGSDLSGSVRLTVTVIEVQAVRLILPQRDLRLAVDATVALQPEIVFADGSVRVLPRGLGSFSSSDASTVRVTGGGFVLGVTPGVALVTVQAFGLSAVTPVAVGGAAPPVNLEFFPESYVLVPGGSRQLIVRERLADGQVVDRTLAAGARYFVENTSLLSVDASGLLQAAALGRSAVTLIYGAQSRVVPIEIAQPVTSGSQVGAQGGLVVAAAGGAVLGVAPGTFAAPTAVTIAPVTQAGLPMALPNGFGFGGAVQVGLGPVLPATGLSLAVPMTSGSPGDLVVLFRAAKLPDGAGALRNIWEVVDRLVIGPDMIARTTSPPHPSISVSGTFALGMAVTGGLMGLVGSLPLLLADAGVSYVETDSGGAPYFSLPGLFADFWLPIPGPDAQTRIKRLSKLAVDAVITQGNPITVTYAPGTVALASIGTSNLPPIVGVPRPEIEQVTVEVRPATPSDPPATTNPGIPNTPSAGGTPTVEVTVTVTEIVITLTPASGVKPGDKVVVEVKDKKAKREPILIVADGFSGELVRVRVGGGVEPLSYQPGLGSPDRIGLASEKDTLYLATGVAGSRSILVLDAVTGSPEREILLPDAVQEVAGLEVVGGQLYVLDPVARKIHFLSTSGGIAGSGIDLPSAVSAVVGGLAYDADSGVIWVGDSSGRLTALNAADGSVVRTTSVPGGVGGLAMQKGTLVAALSTGRIARLNPATGVLVELTDPGVLGYLGGVAAAEAPVGYVRVEAVVRPDGKVAVPAPKSVELRYTEIRVGLRVTIPPKVGGKDLVFQEGTQTGGNGGGGGGGGDPAQPTDPVPPPPPTDPSTPLIFGPAVTPVVAPGYYVVTANTGDNTITVVDPTKIVPNTAALSNAGSGIVARIPVGNFPSDVAISKDGHYAFVSNRGEGTISVIDLVFFREIDLNLETPEIDRIVLDPTGAAQPYYLAIHPTTALGAATDASRGVVYLFSTGDTPGATLSALPLATLDITAGIYVTGLTGIDFTPDGERLYVASPGRAVAYGNDATPFAGYVFVIDYRERKQVAVLTTNQKPFGVTRSPLTANLGDPRRLEAAYNSVAVAIRGDDPTGFTLFDDRGLSRSSVAAALRKVQIGNRLVPFEPQVPDTILLGSPLFNFDRQFFDINSAEGIVFSRDARYAYVVFNSTPNPQDFRTDQFRGRGSNIGILQDPLGLDPDLPTQFIAATEEVPFAFADEITIDPYNRYLYATYKGKNALAVYDLIAIEAVIEALRTLNPRALQYPSKTLEEYAEDLVTSGSLDTYLEKAKIDKALVTETMRERFADLETLLGSGEIVVRRDLNTGIPGIAVGRLPSGVASSPEAPADLVILKATYLQAPPESADTDKIQVYWFSTDSGRTPFSIAIKTDFGVLPIGIENIEALVPIAQVQITGDLLKFGSHSLIIDLGTKLKGGERIYVQLDPGSGGGSVDEVNEVENNVTSFRTYPPAKVSALYDDDRTDTEFGRYIRNVKLDNVFTINLLDEVARIIETSVRVTINGLPVDLNGGSGIWRFVYDVGTIVTGDASLVLTYRNTDNAADTTVTYTFDTFIAPDWINPQVHAEDPKVNAKIEWNPSKEKYEVMRFDRLVNLVQFLNPSLYMFGDLPFGVAAGMFVEFDFDLASTATDTTAGAGLDFYFFSYSETLKVSTAILNELLLGLPFGLGSGASTEFAAGALIKLIQAGNKKAAEDKISPGKLGLFKIGIAETIKKERGSLATALEKGSLINSLIDTKTGKLKDKIDPEFSVSFKNKYTPFKADRNLLLTDGSLDVSFELGASYKISVSTLLPFTGPATPVIAFLVGLEGSIAYKAALSGSIKASGGGTEALLRLGFAADAKLTGSAQAKVFLGLLATASLKLELGLGVGIGLESGRILPAYFRIPANVTLKGDVSAIFGLFKAEKTFVDFFKADNLLYPPGYKGWIIDGAKSGYKLITGAALSEDGFESISGPVDLGYISGTTRLADVNLANEFDVDAFTFGLAATGAAADKLEVRFLSGAGSAVALLTDASGRELWRASATGAEGGETLSFSLNNAGPGRFFLTLEGAPATGVGYELSLVAPVPVGPALAASIQLDRQTVEVGAPVTVTAFVTNIGSALAPSNRVRLVWSRDDLVDLSDASIASLVVVPPLAPGESFRIQFVVLAPPVRQSEIYLGLMADIDMAVSEAHRDDNQAVAALRVNRPPDRFESNDTLLTATDLGVIRGSKLEAGLSIHSFDDTDFFTFRMNAAGGAFDRLTLQLIEGTSLPGIQLLTADGLILAPTVTSTESEGVSTISLAGLPAGLYYLSVSSEDGQHLAYELSGQIAPVAGVNVAVSGSILTTAIAAGSSAASEKALSVVLVNSGTDDAGPFRVQTTIGGLSSGFVDVAGLAAGASMELLLDLNYSGPMAWTATEVMVTVDPGQVLLESSRDDNVWRGSVFLGGVPDGQESAETPTSLGARDLGLVTGVRSVSDRNLHTPTDVDYFTFRIGAPGDAGSRLSVLAAAGAETLVFIFDSEGNQVRANWSGEAGVSEISLTGLPAGSYLVSVRALSGVAPDYTIEVRGPAFAGRGIFEAVQSSISSAPAPDGTVRVTVRIENVGNDATPATLGNWRVSKSADLMGGSGVNLGTEVSIPALATGQSVLIETVLDLDATGLASGLVYVGFMVDPDGLAGPAVRETVFVAGSSILPPADPAESDNSPATASQVLFNNLTGEANFGSRTLVSGMDVDYYAFTLERSARIADSAVLRHLEAESPLSIQILAGDGTTVLRSVDSELGVAVVPLADLRPGSYFIRIQALAREGFSSSYSLAMTVKPYPDFQGLAGAPVVGDPAGNAGGGGAGGATGGSDGPVAPFAGALNVVREGSTAMDMAAAALLNAAYMRWVAVLGYSPAITVNLGFTDLSGSEIGYATQRGLGVGDLTLDLLGGNRGWFIDPTPMDDSEFQSKTHLGSAEALTGSEAHGRYDLLTVLSHELGHLLGFMNTASGYGSAVVNTPSGKRLIFNDVSVPLTADGHHIDPTWRPGDLMTPGLAPSVRKLPSALHAAIIQLVHERRAAAPAGAPVFEEFDDIIEGAVAAGPVVGITNGDFSDPTNGAWRRLGGAQIGSGVAVVRPSANGFLSSLVQVFLMPGQARSLRFDLSGGFVAGVEGQAPSVFEVALLGVGYSDVYGSSARPGGESLISWSAEAQPLLADGVTVVGGGAVNGVTTFDIDLTRVTTAGPLVLSFDLGAFTGTAAAFQIDNVRIIQTGTGEPPEVVGVEINGGAAQRSMVTSVKVRFSSDVSASLLAGDFRLLNVTTGLEVSASVLSLQWIGGENAVVLTFPGLVGRSLADGNYQLTLDAAGITDAAGRTLKTGAAGNPTYVFHRLFGDQDGDRDVDFLDTFYYQRTHGRTSADAAYDARFDWDADTDVDALDLFHFSRNYFTTLPMPQVLPAALIGGAPAGGANSGEVAAVGSAETPAVTAVVSAPTTQWVRRLPVKQGETVKPSVSGREVKVHATGVRSAGEVLPLALEQGAAPLQRDLGARSHIVGESSVWLRTGDPFDAGWFEPDDEAGARDDLGIDGNAETIDEGRVIGSLLEDFEVQRRGEGRGAGEFQPDGGQLGARPGGAKGIDVAAEGHKSGANRHAGAFAKSEKVQRRIDDHGVARSRLPVRPVKPHQKPVAEQPMWHRLAPRGHGIPVDHHPDLDFAAGGRRDAVLTPLQFQADAGVRPPHWHEQPNHAPPLMKLPGTTEADHERHY